jgi:hypothetical protein
LLSKTQRDIFDYWSKAAFWQLDEAAALLVGFDPALARSTYQPRGQLDYNSWRHWKDVRELLSRALTARQIDLNLGPGGILAWAKRLDIAYPPELETAVMRHGQRLVDWKVEAESLRAELAILKSEVSGRDAAPKEIPTRERDGLLKLVIGMAIGGYGYDPKVGRSSTARDIASDLASRGIPLDEDTVRKYLAEARELLPGDETEQND